jgi:hypothetical protein
MEADEYPTCARTFVTLRIYPESLDPDEVTARLGIQPTSWQRRGQVRNPASERPVPAKLHGWFLTSKGAVESRDVRRHLAWLLAQLGPRADAIRDLQAGGCRMDVFCYWLSRNGHGGPAVSPAQMSQLARLGLELGFDVYFQGNETAE